MVLVAQMPQGVTTSGLQSLEVSTEERSIDRHEIVGRQAIARVDACFEGEMGIGLDAQLLERSQHVRNVKPVCHSTVERELVDVDVGLGPLAGRLSDLVIELHRGVQTGEWPGWDPSNSGP